MKQNGMKCFLALSTLLFSFLAASSQQVQKITFDAADSNNGYYLAIPPNSPGTCKDLRGPEACPGIL